jgi:DNA-nicking Smr family endonuclease
VAGRRDKNEETGNHSSSFMSRNFPDATPLKQHKQTIHSTKSRQHGKESFATGSDVELPPLRTPGTSTIGADDVLSYQGNGVQNRIMRQLKTGKVAVQKHLDLHGQTTQQAHQSIMQFIHQCQQQRKYHVLIIHGRGYRSAGGEPVLKRNVDYWLRQHNSVLAFHSASPEDGGTGAVYVLLRKGSG